MIDVLTFGETLAAVGSKATGPLSVGTEMRLSVAGAESNVAIGLARLGHRVRWAGCVGDDELGTAIVRTLRGEGADTSFVRVLTGAPTALMVKQRRLGQVSRVIYYRTNSAGSHIDRGLVEAATAEPFRVLHVTGITPALSRSGHGAIETGLEKAQDVGAHISFDVNYRSALWTREEASKILRPIARLADTVFGSADEIELIADGPDGITALVANGATVVGKEGANGASTTDGSGVTKRAAFPVPIVDPVGAGDAFVAGYLSALLDGLGVRERLERACALGAFSVAADGDWEGLPTRNDLPLLQSAPNDPIR